MRATFLGLTALATIAGSHAFAADLPVAPEPVDYVRVCDAYGTGFFYIPGSETCLRIRGRVRAEYRFQNFGDKNSAWADRTKNDTRTRARGYARLDARTQSEYGLIRAYTSMYVTADSGDSSGGISLEYAYVQFGGFTVGRTQSFWDYWTGYAFGSALDDYSDTKPWIAAYTAGFGDGLSATLSVEDYTFRQTNLIVSGASNGYAGQRLPDLVANLRIDQSWGSAQLMGALHQVRFSSSIPDGQLGWALGAGVEYKLPVFGARDKVVVQAAYTDGASRFPLDNWDSRITDAIYSGGRTQTTKTWNIAAGFQHNINDQWQINFEGGYHNVDALGTAYDFDQWGLNGNIVWEPVSGLSLGFEMEYRDVDYKHAKANGLEEGDEIYAIFRVQRDF